MQAETKFKEKVIKDLEALGGCWVLKTQERARRGVPDLVICLRGLFFAIELKVDGEKPTKLQQHVLGEIRNAQGFAFCTTPAQWAEHLTALKTNVRLL